MSNLSKPARDSIFVFAIALAEARFQVALFAWDDNQIEERARKYKGNQDSDTAINDRLPK